MALEHVATDQEPSRNDDAEPDVKDAAASEDEAASTEIRYRISSYGADYPVDGLVKRLRQGDIAVPTFQREFVWPLPQASRFIESLLLGLPMPSIFLSKDSETQKLMVIDGQQRLKSLRFFYDLADGIVIRRRRKEGFRAGRIGRITRILRVARSTRGRNLSLSDHPACPGTLATVPGGS